MSESDVGLPELPDGWMWLTLEDCTQILDSQRIPINAKERETRINGKPESLNSIRIMGQLDRLGGLMISCLTTNCSY